MNIQPEIEGFDGLPSLHVNGSDIELRNLS
jgi:hypothetical protein